MRLKGLLFAQLNFARQFLLLSFLILLAGMLIIGVWVGEQIKQGVVNRTAAVTALYVDSFIAPYLQDMVGGNQIGKAQLGQLDTLLSDTSLGKRIVAFKIWSQDGVVLYSTTPTLIGRAFPTTPPLNHAFAGEVHTEISNLSDAENVYERQAWSRLLETYAPVRELGTENVIAVAEFYQTTEELDRELNSAQWSSWLVVGVSTLAMYALLFELVQRASNKITSQESDLRNHVNQLKRLLAHNEELRARVQRAAAGATTLNEQFLRRIASDLHDGAAQDLALALLRMESLANACAECAKRMGKAPSVHQDLGTVKTALQSALTDLRTVSSGLRLPALKPLSPREVAERAVSHYQQKTGKLVALALDELPPDLPLPIKITLFRLLQESLTNGFRHAGGADQRVRVAKKGADLFVEISDSGPGFDFKQIPTNGHLGLAGMKERVEVLGGTFAVDSALGVGTTVRITLPLRIPEVSDG